MTEAGTFKQHLIHVPALGRQFKLGDFYDYRTDTTLEDGQHASNLTVLATDIEVKEKFELRIDSHAANTGSSKLHDMGLDKHLQMSVLTGLIDEFHGATSYIEDQPEYEKVSRILVCRAKSREERLNLQDLAVKVFPYLSLSEREKLNATHIVVGIFYGAEAYCVLSRDRNNETEEEVLSSFTFEISETLGNIQDWTEFQKQFEKIKQKGFLNCRIYSDFSQTVRNCNVFEAYKHFWNLIDCMQNEKRIKSNKAVPIVVILCPLKIFVDQERLVSYHGINADLVARCCRIWNKLEHILTKSKTLLKTLERDSKNHLCQFHDAVEKYLEIFKNNLKVSVVKARELGDNSELERVVYIAEKHTIFKPCRLKRWLFYEEAEMDIFKKTRATVNGIQFLTDKEQVKKKSVFGKIFAVVLIFPPIDKRALPFLSELKNYVDNNVNLVMVEKEDDDFDVDSELTEDEEENVGIPFYSVKLKKALVESKVGELKRHVSRNKHNEDYAQFFIILGDRECLFDCCYLVYQYHHVKDSTVYKFNMKQLPRPPTDLRLVLPVNVGGAKRAKASSFEVHMNYNDEGNLPYNFFVEYRTKGTLKSWTQLKTEDSQVTIDFLPGTATEIRVAVDTFLGRSEFSHVIDTESSMNAYVTDSDSDVQSEYEETLIADRMAYDAGSPQSKTADAKNNILHPPSGLKVEIVTKTKADLIWSSPIGHHHLYCHIQYWQSGNVQGYNGSTQRTEIVGFKNTKFRLEHLQPNTMYSANIVLASPCGKKSLPSKIVEFTTLSEEIRFAEIMVQKWAKIGSQSDLDIYEVPLILHNDATTVERYVFGENVKNSEAEQLFGKQHRTLLLVGAENSGKEAIINAMLNYIFDVKWNDPFRFQLMEQGSMCGQLKVYDIHHCEGFKIPYSLTIIDSPEFEKDLTKTQAILELIRQFFDNHGGIQQLDKVGFVAPASQKNLTPIDISILKWVLSTIGEDVKEKIHFLLTFADNQDPPLLQSIADAGLFFPVDEEESHFFYKFNCASFLRSNKKNESQLSKCNQEMSLSSRYQWYKFLWSMSFENFSLFFSSLDTRKTKSLPIVQQLSEEMQHLQSTVDGLLPLIKIGLTKMEEIRTIKRVMTSCKLQIASDIIFDLKVEIAVAQKVKLQFGECVNNCSQCSFTCHNPCGIAKEKENCVVMQSSMPTDIRTCRVCPGKCPWNKHANQTFKWEYVQVTQKTTTEAIKKKYETEANKELTVEEVIDELEKEMESNEASVLDRFVTVVSCYKRLNLLSNQENSVSTQQFINKMIATEKKEKQSGFKKRIKNLKRIRLLDLFNSVEIQRKKQ